MVFALIPSILTQLHKAAQCSTSETGLYLCVATTEVHNVQEALDGRPESDNKLTTVAAGFNDRCKSLRLHQCYVIC